MEAVEEAVKVSCKLCGEKSLISKHMRPNTLGIGRRGPAQAACRHRSARFILGGGNNRLRRRGQVFRRRLMSCQVGWKNIIKCFGFSQEAGMLTQVEHGGRGGVVDIIGGVMRGSLASLAYPSRCRSCARVGASGLPSASGGRNARRTRSWAARPRPSNEPRASSRLQRQRKRKPTMRWRMAFYKDDEAEAPAAPAAEAPAQQEEAQQQAPSEPSPDFIAAFNAQMESERSARLTAAWHASKPVTT